VCSDVDPPDGNMHDSDGSGLMVETLLTDCVTGSGLPVIPGACISIIMT